MKKMSKLLAMLLAVAMICGMLAVSASDADKTIAGLEKHGLKPSVIGKVVKGKGVTIK